MDPAKIKLLFDRVPTWADPNDPEDRSELLSDEFGNDLEGPGGSRLAMYETIANQIADDDPPEVWKTAQQLLGAGLDRGRVLQNLALALTSCVQSMLAEERPFRADAYRVVLERLPLPTESDLEEAMVTIARKHQPIAIEELESLAMARLGLPREEPFETFMHSVSDRVIGADGSLAILPGDVVVEPRSLLTGVVLTRRLTEAERASNALAVGIDLVGFLRTGSALKTNLGEELHPMLTEGRLAVGGPDGWLRRFEAGDLLDVRMSGDTVTIDALDEAPSFDPTLVARIRAAYDAEVQEPWLPVSAEDVLLGVLSSDRTLFAMPQPPLSELCDAAGLEIRDQHLAHEESVWETQRKLNRDFRIYDLLGDKQERDAAVRVLDCFEERSEDPAVLRDVLVDLREPMVLRVVLDEMFGLDDDPQRVDAAAAFAERAVAAARRPAESAAARLVAAVAAERRGDPLEAETHLHLAIEADGDWGPAVDRLAWYLSDRGEAEEAARLWRRLGSTPEENDDLRELERFTGRAGPKRGRNDPCWCGSGRKFKHCHLGRTATAPLTDRVGWLCRKATAYLERRGGAPIHDLFDLALARAGDGEAASLSEAMSDPFVIDIALHELGWFEQFIDERGALLPEDEALLAASWMLVDRSIYEILRVDPGVGIEVQDLRSAEQLEVRERTFSHQARPGKLICARAVPDGETHQFIGGLFSVEPGTERGLLDLLDEADGYDLMEYLAALERPPRVVTREREEMVACTSVLEVSDARKARDALDRLYERVEAGRWVEMHALEDGDNVLRATLHLDGTRLTIETMSEQRVERVKASLLNEIAGATVLSEERQPVDFRRRPDKAIPTSRLPADPDLRSALEEWRDQMEERWCDEPVPALGDLTPRQAAADPTRREAVERLLVSYEEMDDDLYSEGAVTLRPARLRGLLKLDKS